MTLHSAWNSPGQNTGVGSLSLLQRIFPTQGSNSGLLHYRQILYQLSYKGCPRILEWVAYLSSRGSSRPRNRTRVSCIAGGFFYQLSYQGSPKCWSGLPFTSSRGPSQPRDQTRVSCIAGRFFTNQVIREALIAGVGCHLLLPGDLPDPGIEPESPALQADSLPLSHQGSPIHILWPRALTPRYTSNYNIYQQLPNKYTRILRVVPFLIVPKIKQLHVHQNKMDKLEHNTAMRINQILLHTLTQTNLINIY